MMEKAEISENETAVIKAVRTAFQAYADRNRAAIEQVLAEDFHFSSPRDNRIDREVYFARWRGCNSRRFRAGVFARLGYQAKMLADLPRLQDYVGRMYQRPHAP